MGSYCTFSVGHKSGQVKIYSDDHSEIFIKKSTVPNELEHKTYSVAMREGGFVNIKDLIVESWTSKPKHESVYDKWGGNFADGTVGILGEPYLFLDKTRNRKKLKKTSPRPRAGERRRDMKNMKLDTKERIQKAYRIYGSCHDDPCILCAGDGLARLFTCPKCGGHEARLMRTKDGAAVVWCLGENPVCTFCCDIKDSKSYSLVILRPCLSCAGSGLRA